MNHQYQRSIRDIRDDVSEVSYYATAPTSPEAEATDLEFENIDVIQLDNLITANSPFENYQNQNTPPKVDNIDDIFDFLSISDTSRDIASQKNNSTSNANFTEFQKSKEFNLDSNYIENTEEDLIIKADLVQCQFSYPSKPQSFIKTTESGDMAFLYRCNKDIVSVCFNRMQYEAEIPLGQLTGFCITNDGKILIKLKNDYRHYFSHHLGEFPYLLEPTPMNYDPTDNKFERAQSLLLTPQSSERLPTLMSLESRIEKLYFRKNGIYNEAITEDGLKIYITCVFPHERRAIAFPINASFQRLLTVIESRFGKKSPTLRFRKKKEWIEINNDEIWWAVKGQAFEKRILRLELHIL